MGKEDRKSEKKHKKHKKQKKKHAPLPSDAPRLSEDDYFRRSIEFRVWLTLEKKKYLEDLSTDEASDLFNDKFVRRWNKGKLRRMYYEGIPETVVNQTKRTRHNWGISSSLNEQEQMTLATTKDSVDVATRRTDLLSSHPQTQAYPPKTAVDSKYGPKQSYDKEGRKRKREDDQVVLDELAPKETSRDVRFEKRKQTNERMHAAARDRDSTQDGLDLGESFLMGDTGDDYQRRLQQRSQARQSRQQEKTSRAMDAKAKEDARMDQFLSDMGLSNRSSKDPITIRPRE